MDTSGLPGTVREHLEDRRSELFEVAEELIGYDTQNPPGETAAIVARLRDVLEAAGVATERVEVDPEKPNLVAQIPGETDRTLGFNGHLDTVPFDASDWEHAPLGERVEDRFYGRGATDMKGAVAAMVHVACAYGRAEIRPPVGLEFAFVSDEEVGGDAGLTTVVDTGRFEPDACVVGETTSRAGRYSVSVADRGFIWLTIEATGTAAHGSRPMIGENAIDRLYEGVGRLRSEFGTRPLSIDPAMDPIIEESVGFYEPEAGADAARELYRYPTINLGILEGGTAVNTVPASACARVDVRLTAGVETMDALRSIRACLGGLDGIELIDVSWTSGTYEPLDSPLVGAAKAAGERVVDERVYRRSATGGGDAKTLRNNGVPTVEFGFGTQTAHGTDEYTTETALTRNAVAYAALPYEFAACRTT